MSQNMENGLPTQMNQESRLTDQDLNHLAEWLAADFIQVAQLPTKDTTILNLMEQSIFAVLSGENKEESKLRQFLISSLSCIVEGLSGVAVNQPLYCLSKAKVKKLSAIGDQMELLVQQLMEAFYTWEDN